MSTAPFTSLGLDEAGITNLAQLKDYILQDVDAGGGGNGGSVMPTLKVIDVTSGGGQIVGSVPLARLGIVTKITSDKPMRIRLYPTASARDADIARTAQTASSPGASVLFEGITVPGLLSFNTGPTPYVYNGDNPVTNMLYYTLEPTANQGAVCTFSFYEFA